MNKPEVLTLLSLPDRYVRACWRKELLTAFDRAGLVVDVVGHNWEAFPAGTRHRFHATVAFDALPALLQRANVVLHAGANFPTGSHERVLTAMACGAVACADHTAFYASSFVLGRDLLTYPQGHFDELAETVRTLLEDPDRLAELQRCGPRAVAAGHTWAARARSLVDLVS